MRRTLRLALVAAAAAVAIPTAPANAIYCGELLDDACRTLCQVYYDLGRPCPR